MEGDLKMAQETVLDLERGKRELEQNIMRKDTELNALMGKLDEEQGGVGRTQRQIKEYTGRVEEMEEELEQSVLGEWLSGTVGRRLGHAKLHAGLAGRSSHHTG